MTHSFSKPSSLPILLVDKEGVLGSSLARKMQQHFLTVFVSGKELEETNVIFVPFQKKIPVIPDNTFSHIILIYSGEKELQEALPSFIKKAKESHARFFLITSIFHYRDTLARKLFALYDKAQVIVVGDVFSPDLTGFNSPVTSLLLMAKTFGRLELTNSGLDNLYPVALSDAVESIQEIVMKSDEDHHIFAVLPKHPLTQLSFARLLQKTYPLLQIDFVKSKHHSLPLHLPSSALLALDDPYPLERRLLSLDLTHTPLATEQLPKKRMRGAEKSASIKRSFFLTVSLLCFFIALPFLLTVGMAVAGGLALQQAEKQLAEGQLQEARDFAQAASSFFRLSDQTATTLRLGVSLFGLDHEIIGFQNVIHTGKELSEAVEKMLESGLTLQSLIESPTPITKDSYQQALNTLKSSMIAIRTIQAEGNLPRSYQQRLKELEEPMTLLINLVDVSPTLFGFDRPKQYLILFQNNFELRPTGGFIGSYGLIKLDRGKIASFTIHDVYDADGRLTAAIEPPFALRRYLGASNWFLRDSNYSIDFHKSAADAASFLKLETGESVDGVIGIDVTFLAFLLDATGPIKLPDYRETITKDNFYIMAQRYVENNFFPGSSQKKDFLRALQSELLGKFQTHTFSYQKLLLIVSQAALQKHLIFAFPDTSMQKLFSVNHLSASLDDFRSPEPNTFFDTVGINETNVGQNKSNYYLKRSISQEIMIDKEGIVREIVTIKFTNTSTRTSEFGGDYKAYLRLITPSGTILTDVLFDATQQIIIPAVTNENTYLAKSFKPPKGVEIEEVTERGKKIFGMFLTVPQGQSKTVTFGYRLQNRIPVDAQEWKYDLWVIKQPGTLNDPFTLRLTYPLANRLFKASVRVGDLGGKVVYESTLLTDQRLNFTFTQR